MSTKGICRFEGSLRQNLCSGALPRQFLMVFHLISSCKKMHLISIFPILQSESRNSVITKCQSQFKLEAFTGVAIEHCHFNQTKRWKLKTLLLIFISNLLAEPYVYSKDHKITHLSWIWVSPLMMMGVLKVKGMKAMLISFTKTITSHFSIQVA